MGLEAHLAVQSEEVDLVEGVTSRFGDWCVELVCEIVVLRVWVVEEVEASALVRMAWVVATEAVAGVELQVEQQVVEGGHVPWAYGVGGEVVDGVRSCPNNVPLADLTAVSTMRRICGWRKLRRVLAWFGGPVDEGVDGWSADHGAGVGGKDVVGGWPAKR